MILPTSRFNLDGFADEQLTICNCLGLAGDMSRITQVSAYKYISQFSKAPFSMPTTVVKSSTDEANQTQRVDNFTAVIGILK
eukprot:g42499.t1